jgi:hypothetical protein
MVNGAVANSQQGHTAGQREFADDGKIAIDPDTKLVPTFAGGTDRAGYGTDGGTR